MADLDTRAKRFSMMNHITPISIDLISIGGGVVANDRATFQHLYSGIPFDDAVAVVLAGGSSSQRRDRRARYRTY